MEIRFPAIQSLQTLKYISYVNIDHGKASFLYQVFIIADRIKMEVHSIVSFTPETYPLT